MSGIDGSAGVLEPFADCYQVRLLELGYRPGTIERQLRELRQLGGWMATAGVEPRELDVSMIELLLDSLRAADDSGVPTARSFARLLEFSLNEGIAAPPGCSLPSTSLDQLTEDYRRWLLVERQLAPSTARRYERVARCFLEQRIPLADGGGVGDLTGADVTGFLEGECARVSARSARGAVGDLRALLRFLRLRGLTDLALGDSIPPVASWRCAKRRDARLWRRAGPRRFPGLAFVSAWARDRNVGIAPAEHFCEHVVVTDGSDKYRRAQAIAGHQVKSSRSRPAYGSSLSGRARRSASMQYGQTKR